MPKCRKCSSVRWTVISKTKFGQGDSSTDTYVQCDDCDNTSVHVTIHGFPTTYDIVREVQDDYTKDNSYDM